LTSTSAVIVSLLVSALTLFLVGAAITLFTGRNALSTGLRQLLFGAVAAGVTYGIGHLLGVTLAG
jgi:vacuolar iron transporter family protein